MLGYHGRRPVRHAADHADRRRRGDVRHGQRLRPVPAASGEPQAARLRAARTAATTRSIIRRPIRARLTPRREMQGAGWEYRRRKAKLQSHDRGARRLARRQSVSQAANTTTATAKSAISSAATAQPKAPTSIRPRSSTPAACWASACARIATLDGADGFLAAAGRRRAKSAIRRPARRPRCSARSSRSSISTKAR